MATEQRKLVSVVFADVVGSTAFGSDNDPEAVRSVMGSYFERMKAIAELHGGTVEKFIGDAVMVVFGVPLLHDDDAERAVRAGLAMRDAMAALNEELRVTLAARVGVNSGEAVAGTGADRQFLVTGDAVNVAARLQQGAESGEVVVGALTESLTRSAIEYSTRESVVAKGKAEPIKSFRAERARSAVPEQARGLPAMRAQLVGRQRELRMLLESFERVRDDRRAHLFTLVGNAGIGKSRLVGEVLARIAGSDSANVLRGRCLPYGAGITYWPLMEIVREDAGISGEDGRDAALAKLDTRTRELLGPEAGAVRARLATMLALQRAEESLPEVTPEQFAREIAWGARQYLAAVARTPAVIVVDDLQWAEPAVVEIIEGLADSTQDAPLLLLCVARPQLLEARATWGAGRANATTITLDALSSDETRTLISRLLDIDDLPADLRARVVERSEGNPLFCEEFLRMLIDDGRVTRVDDRWRATASVTDVRVPESIHALLAARLDNLGEDERRTLQVASIVGERFGAAELGALAPGLDIDAAIVSLRRAGLVLEDRETRDAGRFRFKHLLMRDVAYAGLPKSVRADLHERFATTLERSVGDRREEFAEVLGHHAERAFALSGEVRAHAKVLVPRAKRALEFALALGDRARRREDIGLLALNAATAVAAMATLGSDVTADERARVALLSAEDRRLAGDFIPATAAFEHSFELAVAAGRTDLAAWSRLGLARVVALSGDFDQALMAKWARDTAEAERLFIESGDPGAALEAGLIGLERLWAAGELSEMLARGQALRERARQLGDAPRELLICARLIGVAAQSGRTAVAREFAGAADELATRLGGRLPLHGRSARCQRLRAIGDIAGADACFQATYAEGVAENDQILQLSALRKRGELLLEAGRPEEARPPLEEALAKSIRTGELWSRTELTASLGQIAAAAGDDARALELIREAEEIMRETDLYAVAYVYFSAGRVNELIGRPAEAETAYRRAFDVFGRTEYLLDASILRMTFAEFLVTQGRLADAQREFEFVEPVLRDQVGDGLRRLTALREALALQREPG
jgi:class 3 adenylate cyclase/tetratricopeptide (TPR) repeat protein